MRKIKVFSRIYKSLLVLCLNMFSVSVSVSVSFQYVFFSIDNNIKFSTQCRKVACLYLFQLFFLSCFISIFTLSIHILIKKIQEQIKVFGRTTKKKLRLPIHFLCTSTLLLCFASVSLHFVLSDWTKPNHICTF